MGSAIATIDAGNYPAIGEGNERLAEIMADNLGTEVGEQDFQRIKVPTQGGTQFTIPGLEGDILEETITGIIIFKANRKAYWKTSFEDSGAGSPPDCSSVNAIQGIGTPGGACGRCPLNQFGSAEKGEGKACADFVLLFVMRPGQFMPDIIKVPPTSITKVRKYFATLVSNRLSYYQVETEITAEKDKAGNGMTISRLSFKAVSRVPDEQFDAIRSTHESIKKAAESVDIIDIAKDDSLD